MDKCLTRLDVLKLGVQRIIEDKQDVQDLKRHQCSCGQCWTKFDVCPACFMARLSKEAGL